MAMTTSLQIKQSLSQEEILNDIIKMILNQSPFQTLLIKMTLLNQRLKREITLKKVLESLEIISERLRLSTNRMNLLKMKSLDKQVIKILL